MPVRLILVGGFLGAGKTTLLARAASILVHRGLRVGLLTNDQAADLVDTHLLKTQGFGVREIPGGCFCCRFEDLLDASNKLVADLHPDVVIGEPVGSCTDLAATVLRPIAKLHADRFRPAPFTVLADPERLAEAIDDGPALLSDGVLYIYRKQLEEADLLAINKTDTLSEEALRSLKDRLAAAFPGKRVYEMSARDGRGVDTWLDDVLSDMPSATSGIDVDYDVYAEGEARLGWLNAVVGALAEPAADWTEFAESFLVVFRNRIRSGRGEIAHVKVFIRTADGAVSASLTSGRDEPCLRDETAPRLKPSDRSEITVNARVEMAPEAIRQALNDTIKEISTEGLRLAVARCEAFRPGRPNPTHRMGVETR